MLREEERHDRAWAQTIGPVVVDLSGLAVLFATRDDNTSRGGEQVEMERGWNVFFAACAINCRRYKEA